MEDRRIEELLQKMEKFKQQLENNKEASKKFLERAGIIDKKGELEENYKHLCIPQEQA